MLGGIGLINLFKMGEEEKNHELLLKSSFFACIHLIHKKIELVIAIFQVEEIPSMLLGL